MPRLANDRNEMYCRHRARGMNPAKASAAAGYAPGSSTTHLEADQEIVARYTELHEEFVRQKEQQRAAAVEAARVVGQLTGVGRSWVIQQLAEVAGLAKQSEQFKEAINALELIGKDFGMFSGGGSEDNPNAVPQTLDIDKIGDLLSGAIDAIPVTLSDMEKSRQFGNDTALSLIEGQAKRVRLEEDRTLSTGSETDVSLTRNFDEDDDEMIGGEDFEPLEDLPEEEYIDDEDDPA